MTILKRRGLIPMVHIRTTANYLHVFVIYSRGLVIDDQHNRFKVWSMRHDYGILVSFIFDFKLLINMKSVIFLARELRSIASDHSYIDKTWPIT